MRIEENQGLRLALSVAEDFTASETRVPVRAHVLPEDLLARLDFGLQRDGLPLDGVADLLRSVLELTPSSTSPRFFNQLFAGRDAAATMGDMLAAVANTSMYTYKVAGPQVLIEKELVDHMARFVGFEGGQGIFCPGGSLSNMAAMIVARNTAVEGVRESGLTGDRLTVYSSAEAHYSIRKACGMIGIGRENVRAIPVDDAGRMRADALRERIAADIGDGARPVMINVTSGTTVRGSFDPIREIGEVAKEFGIWLHVDAAFGGSVALSRRHRHLLDGSELADSFTWDAHKMMGVPLTCSIVLTRDPVALTKHFCESAGYLFQQDSDDLNPGTRSIQCGRRNDALKLWAAWKHHGDDGYEQRIDRLFDLAQFACACVREDPDLVLSEEPQSINVCFEVRGKSSEAICERLDREARIKVGHGDVKGRQVIRLVCANPDIEHSDVRTFFEEVKRAAELV